MIEVELPDGTIAEVETDDDEIARDTVRKYLAGQRQAVGETPPAPPTPGADTRTAADPGSPQRMLADSKIDETPPGPWRGIRLGAQAAGQGLADIAGAPVDLATGAINAAATLGEMGANALPGVDGVNLGRITNPFGGSQSISDTVGNIAGAAGYDPAKPETAFERLGVNINRFGTQGIAGAAAAARGLLGKLLAQPYAKPGPGALAVDAAAGTGTGTALTAAEPLMEELPEAARPIADAVVSLAGGMAGARGAQIVSSPVKGAQAVARHYSTDPETGVANATADKAAKEMQGAAVGDAGVIARGLREQSADNRYANVPNPTSGSMTGDPGLVALEQRSRLGVDKSQMVQRDREVTTSAGNQVSSLKPENADSRAPEKFVRGQVQERRGQSQADLMSADADLANTQAANAGKVSSAEDRYAGALSEADKKVAEFEAGLAAAREEQRRLGGTVQGRRNDDVAASERLAGAVAEAKAADEAKKSGLYREAGDLSKETPVDIGSLVADAAAVRKDISPLAAQNETLNNIMGDLERLGTEGAAPVTAKDLIDMRPRLSAAMKESRKNLQGDVSDKLGRINDSIAIQLDDLAKNGVPGALKWREAEQNFRDDFAPKYREGVGRDLDRAERAGTPVPPSAQSGKFLRPGAGGKEAAEDLNRILGEHGSVVARDAVLADMAKVVGRDGAISPHTLREWRSKREGMFQAMPGLREEVDGLLRDVVNGETKVGKLQQELTDATAARRSTETTRRQEISKINADNKLTEAQKRAAVADAQRKAADTERDIQNDAATLILDKEPAKAVAEVFGGKDPEVQMKAIVERLSSSKDAAAGWKKAVTEYLEQSTTGTDISKTTDGSHNTIPNKVIGLFKKNEKTLAAVYSPEEMAVLQRVHRSMGAMQQRGTGATVGSQTAENSAVMNVAQGTILAATGSAIKTGMIMARIKFLRRLMPDDGAVVDRLLTRAQLDPELAAHLLERNVPDMKLPAWNKKLTRLMGLTEASRESGEDEDSSESEK